jgi:hypothetical protein
MSMKDTGRSGGQDTKGLTQNLKHQKIINGFVHGCPSFIISL